MFVRILQQHEVAPALQLIHDTFMLDVAPGIEESGVKEFHEMIEYQHIMQKYATGEYVFFGAFEGLELLGAGAVQNGKHIPLLFVQKRHQRNGVGRALFQEMCRFCVQKYSVIRITVNAMKGSVLPFEKYGMGVQKEEQNSKSLCFTPMEIIIPAAMIPPQPQQKSHAGLIIGIVGGVIALLILLISIGVFSVQRYIRQSYDSSWSYPYDEYDSYEDWDYDYGDPYSGDTTDLSGLEQIPAHEETGITYTVEDKLYDYDAQETKNTVLYFDVSYPELSGLSTEVQSKVNETLKTCAIESVDRLYLNPTQEIKEKVLGEEYPMLASYVTYKVAYQGKEFISVVFEDQSYEGSSEDSRLQIRTVNISLKDGKVYEVKDIVKLDESFLSAWLTGMRSESDSDILSELDQEQMKKALSGDDPEGVYSDSFFVDADGLEIGFSFKYPKGDVNDLGYAWVTAPFTTDELKAHKTDSTFWKEIFK